MKKYVLGCFLAALAIFVWGFIFWGVLPVTGTIFTTYGDDPGLNQALADTLSETGTYLWPYDAADMEGTANRQAEGPFVTIHYHKEGVDAGSPMIFLGGFLHMLIAVIVIAYLLKLASLASFKARVTLVTVAGLAGAIFSNLGEPIWWHQSWTYHVMHSVYDFVAWLIAGLILGYFLRPGS